jgi:hypothetical protein
MHSVSFVLLTLKWRLTTRSAALAHVCMNVCMYVWVCMSVYVFMYMWRGNHFNIL